MQENELDFAPLRAADFTPDDSPHTSFASPMVIDEVLREAGFVRITIRPFDAQVSCGGVEAMLDVATRVGALGKRLRESPDLRAKAVPQVRTMLEERAIAGRVGLTTATWIVRALSPCR